MQMQMVRVVMEIVGAKEGDEGSTGSRTLVQTFKTMNSQIGGFMQQEAAKSG